MRDFLEQCRLTPAETGNTSGCKEVDDYEKKKTTDSGGTVEI